MTDASPAPKKKSSNLVVIGQALLIALFIRTFLFQSVSIPSESMKATLLVGDYLFVNKMAYGYANASLPFAPDLFKGRIFAKLPKRGDIAVFRGPHRPDIDFIKRVIGLPGDKVQMKGGVVYLNGQAIPKVKIADYADETGRFAQFRETLPDGTSYEVLDLIDNGEADNTTLFTVPDNHLFMMGDNRDDSADSRFQFDMGYVPVDLLVGRADLRYFSIRPDYPFWQVWHWPKSIRFTRLFNIL